MTVRLKTLLAGGALIACVALVWTLASVGASSVRANEPLVPNAPIGVKQAIAAAEAHGGAAENVAFSDEAGGRWEIAVAPAPSGEASIVLVDPNSGKVVGRKPRPTKLAAAGVTTAEAGQAATAGSLSSAVALAEERVNGTAIEARAETDGAQPAHIVSLSTLDGRKDVRVTAQGEVIPE
ncbi:PepSY domain-containing protein [Chelatococcus sambhunathii]|uniref:PepSY domain-containing protein n=1 Tax=Chelatococcus sambhunathii TaxID=363953 RepID=A0ABU1DE60_9HYPH|nr:PepSY domain-containing protein [Chelatococcus sambhunathii]MDR4306355.1 PepSY domain-containing protein [Chelatococcus sambhunathii]